MSSVKNNIILIGFMGVGKGTMARFLAKNFQHIAIDTDDIIESMEKREIKKIFKKKGERYFRNLEQKVANWIEKDINNTIISTGGGFPIYINNIKNLGQIIYLYSSFDNILKRIYASKNPNQKLKKRPLFKEQEKAKELYNKRESFYKKCADITIDVSNKQPIDVLQQIKSLQLIKKFT